VPFQIDFVQYSFLLFGKQPDKRGLPNLSRTPEDKRFSTAGFDPRDEMPF
jgi:hypothetical protein